MEYYSYIDPQYTTCSSSSEQVYSQNVIYEPTYEPVINPIIIEPVQPVPVVPTPIEVTAIPLPAPVESYHYQTSSSICEEESAVQTTASEEWKGEPLKEKAESKETIETETITVLNETGQWVNKADEANWTGPVALKDYPINQDTNPEIIHKRSTQQLTYIQEISIRYLKPPPTRPHGEIVIKEEKAFLPPKAPPIILRQQPPRPHTPPPLVLREKPPQPPETFDRKVIMVPGKRLPPPPRKVIIERLAPLPPKPQAIIIERWLAYKEHKRKVVFCKAPEVQPHAKEHNVIVEWEKPKAHVKTVIKDLGIIRADPNDYIQRFGDQLKRFDELPEFAKKIKPSGEVLLASDAKYKCELEGDLFALSLIDLEKEGLQRYRSCLKEISYSSHSERYVPQELYYEEAEPVRSTIISTPQPQEKSVLEIHFDEICDSLAINKQLGVTWEQGRRILKLLNEKLNRYYDEDKCENFLRRLNPLKTLYMDFNSFKNSVLNEGPTQSM